MDSKKMMKAAQANAVILHIVYKTLLPVFIVLSMRHLFDFRKIIIYIRKEMY